jgi:hypothetical protein
VRCSTSHPFKGHGWSTAISSDLAASRESCSRPSASCGWPCPIALVKEARRQLGEITVAKRELATTIIGEDEAAKRLAVFLGFHVADEGPGKTAYRRPKKRTKSGPLSHTTPWGYDPPG